MIISSFLLIILVFLFHFLEPTAAIDLNTFGIIDLPCYSTSVIGPAAQNTISQKKDGVGIMGICNSGSTIIFESTYEDPPGTTLTRNYLTVAIAPTSITVTPHTGPPINVACSADSRFLVYQNSGMITAACRNEGSNTFVSGNTPNILEFEKSEKIASISGASMPNKIHLIEEYSQSQIDEMMDIYLLPTPADINRVIFGANGQQGSFTPASNSHTLTIVGLTDPKSLTHPLPGFSQNSTHLAQGEKITISKNPVAFANDNILSFQFKVMMTNGLNNWLTIIDSSDAGPPGVGVMLNFKSSFTIDGKVSISLNGEVKTYATVFQEGKVLDIIFSFVTSKAGSNEMHIFTSIQGVNYEKYVKTDTNIGQKIINPVIELLNTDTTGKILRVYSLMYFDGAGLGTTCLKTNVMPMSKCSYGYLEGSSVMCLDCKANKYLKIDALECVDDCPGILPLPPVASINNLRLKECRPQNALACTTVTSEIPCSKCKNSFFSFQGTCMPCDATCANCEESSTVCTTCLPTDFIQENKCVGACSDGFYSKLTPLKECIPCTSHCLTCNNLQCLQCNTETSMELIVQIPGPSNVKVCKSKMGELINKSKGERKMIVKEFTNYFFPGGGPVMTPGSWNFTQEGYSSKCIHGYTKIVGIQGSAEVAGRHTIVRVTEKGENFERDHGSDPAQNQLALFFEMDGLDQCTLYASFSNVYKFVNGVEKHQVSVVTCSVIINRWVYFSIGGDMDEGNYAASFVFQNDDQSMEIRYFELKNNLRGSNLSRMSFMDRPFNIRFGGFGKRGSSAKRTSEKEADDLMPMRYKFWKLDSSFITDETHFFNQVSHGTPGLLYKLKIPDNFWRKVIPGSATPYVATYNTPTFHEVKVNDASNYLMDNWYHKNSLHFAHTNIVDSRAQVLTELEFSFDKPFVFSLWYKPAIYEGVASEEHHYKTMVFKCATCPLSHQFSMELTSIVFSGLTKLKYRIKLFNNIDANEVIIPSTAPADKVLGLTYVNLVFEYRRMLGNRNPFFRVFFNGALETDSIYKYRFQDVDIPKLTEKHRIEIKYGNTAAFPPDAGSVKHRWGFGHFRNVTMHVNTGVQIACPTGCLLCTNSLDCLYIHQSQNPAWYLYGFYPLQVCPYLTNPNEMRICTEEQDIFNMNGNKVSVAGFSATTSVTQPAGGIQYDLSLAAIDQNKAYLRYIDQTSLGIPKTQTINNLEINVFSPNDNMCLYGIMAINVKIPGIAYEAIPVSVTRQSLNNFRIRYSIKDFNSLSRGDMLIMATIKTQACTCEDYEVDTSSGYIRRCAPKYTAVTDYCPSYCSSCLTGQDFGRMNCIGCKDAITTPDFMDKTYQTLEKTERFCDPETDLQYLSKPTVPPATDYTAECEFFKIKEFPIPHSLNYNSTLKDHYHCLDDLPSASTIYYSDSSINVTYKGSTTGRFTYGDFNCFLDCSWYQSLQEYNKVCETEFKVVRTFPDTGKFRCCRRGSNSDDCVISCASKTNKGWYPNSSNICTAPAANEYAKVETIDSYFYPNTWKAVAGDITTDCTLFDEEILVCYDSPDPTQIPVNVGTPSFKFEICSNYIFNVETNAYECLAGGCVRFPYFISMGNSCEMCPSTQVYDKIFGGCIASCDVSGGTIKIRNLTYKHPKTGVLVDHPAYCASCDDPFMSNVNDCQSFCDSSEFRYTKNSETRCVAACPIDTVTNTNTMTCDECLAPDQHKLGGACVNSRCSSNKYQNLISLECFPCHNKCKTCTGPKEDQCLDCYPTFGLKIIEFEDVGGVTTRKFVPSQCIGCSYECDNSDCNSDYYRNCNTCRSIFEPFSTLDKPGLVLCKLNSCQFGTILVQQFEGGFPVSRCIECKDQFPGCLYCTPDSCLVCDQDMMPVWTRDSQGELRSIECKTCKSGTTNSHGDFYFDEEKGQCREICGTSKRYDAKLAPNLQLFKQCDDGNLDDEDGCSAECTIETNFDCLGGTPSSPDTCFYNQEPEAMIKSLDQERFVVYVEFNDQMEVTSKNANTLIKFQILGLNGDYDYDYSIKWDNEFNKKFSVNVSPYLSLTNVTFRITFKSKDIRNTRGKILTTQVLEGIMSQYIRDNIFDQLGIMFIESTSTQIYIFLLVFMMFFNHEQVYVFFNNIYYTFILFLLPVNFDPATQRIARALLAPLLSYDFVEQIKGDSPSLLPPRYPGFGISDTFLYNVTPFIAATLLLSFVVIMLRLQVSGHFTRKKLDILGLGVIQLKEYMDLAGFWNCIRLFYPQVFLFSFICIRNYTMVVPVHNLIASMVFFFGSIVIILRLYIITSYTIHERNAIMLINEKLKSNNKKKKEEKEKQLKKQQERRRRRREESATLSTITKNLDTQTEENQPLTVINMGEDDINADYMKQNQELAKILGLNFTEITLQGIDNAERDDYSLTNKNLTRKKLQLNYNKKYFMIFNHMRIQIYWVRMYPFFEMLYCSLISFFIVVYNDQNYATTQAICILIVESIFCLGSAVLKPYHDSKENMKLISDKIICFFICLMICMLSIDQQRDIFGKYVRVRIVERGFLYVLIWVKIFLNFGFYFVKTGVRAYQMSKYYIFGEGNRVLKTLNSNFVSEKMLEKKVYSDQRKLKNKERQKKGKPLRRDNMNIRDGKGKTKGSTRGGKNREKLQTIGKKRGIKMRIKQSTIGESQLGDSLKPQKEEDK